MIFLQLVYADFEHKICLCWYPEWPHLVLRSEPFRAGALGKEIFVLMGFDSTLKQLKQKIF